MGNRCEVSEPVIFDILLYLPVKSLLRFKTVCKSWCSIIESTGFISQHLHHNSEKDNAIVSNYGQLVSSYNQLCLINARECELCLNLYFECMFPMDKLRGLSSCNGIVCLVFLLSKYYWRVCLWNPATKQARELPEASYLCCQPSDETFAFHIFSIGFDKKINDYKIISMSVECLIRSVEYTGPDVVKGSLVLVYSMRNDSWRTIHEGDEFPVACFHEDKLLCNGEICLCIVNTPDSIVNAPDGTTALFYFDVVDEVYGVVPLPKYPLDATWNSPAFLNGKIGYIEWIPELSHDNPWMFASSYYEIWVMKEFGVKESWYKVYRFEDTLLPCNYTSLLYLSKNGDFILSSKKCETDCELYLYDLVTREVKCVGVQNVDRITNYSESLVSVKSNSDIGPVYVAE